MGAREGDSGVAAEAPALSPVIGIDERPRSWWESVLYAWQHTLVDISPFVTPLIIAAALGMTASEQADLINFCLLAMGVATLLQTTLGNRLPIIQGPSVTVIAAMAPVGRQLGGGAMWGAAFVGGLLEAIVGATGALRVLRRVLTPRVAGVVVLAIGLSLGRLAARLAIGDGRPANFLFAGAVVAAVLTLQLGCGRMLGGLVARASVFLSIWFVGLGIGGAVGAVDWSLVASKPWFSLPRPMPFGGPLLGWELSGTAVLVVLAGYLGSMVESIGDYAATASVTGVPLRLRHVHRGLAAEGIGCAVATLLGGLPCTSFSQNIGIIAATRVASRYVVQLAAVVLMAYGLCPKFGALLVAMPRAVLGGVFLLICGLIVVAGLRMIDPATLDLGESAMVGITLVVSTALPFVVEGELGQAWLEGQPILVRLVLTNPVVLAVGLAVLLTAVTPSRDRGSLLALD